MANVYTEVVKKREKVPLLPIWYQENPGEVALLAGSLSILNKDKLAYTDGIAGIVKKTNMSRTGVDIERDVEDRRKQELTVTTATSATVVVLASAPVNLTPGTVLFNKNTRDRAIVQSISGTTITLVSPGFTLPGYAAGNQLLDANYAKPYGVDQGKTSIRNDYASYSNKIQITERVVSSDMIQNNKTLLNMEAKEVQADKITSIVRDMKLDVFDSFYFGRQGAKVIGSDTYYYCGGLDEFIQSGNKFKINKTSAKGIVDNVLAKVRLAHQSGVPNVQGDMILVCTSKMKEILTSAFSSMGTLISNETYKGHDLELGTISQNGYKLKYMTSTYLDVVQGDYALGFYVPVSQMGMFAFPYTGQTTDQGRSLAPYNSAIFIDKSSNPDIPEVSRNAIWAQYSFMFGYHNTPAYQRWIIA